MREWCLPGRPDWRAARLSRPMSEDPPRRHLREIPMIYPAPEPDQVAVTAGVEYAQTEMGPLTLDVYAPARRAPSVALPAIVLVAGYSDAGYEKLLGCRFKDMAVCTSWARLVASFGMVAVTYGNLLPAADLDDVLRYCASTPPNWASTAIAWRCGDMSGNGPLALSALARAPRGSFRCAVFSCAYLVDLDGATHVADAAAQWGFTNPGGFAVEDLPADLPIFIARAGQEQDPGLNQARRSLRGGDAGRQPPDHVRELRGRAARVRAVPRHARDARGDAADDPLRALPPRRHRRRRRERVDSGGSRRA